MLDNLIATPIFTSTKEFLEKKRSLITEAINFPTGTYDCPQKIVTANFSTDREAYFYKPGKETQRRNPNIYDMNPNVGIIGGVSETARWAFQQLWEYLIKISIIQQDTFKKVLVLLYRLCFLTDHKENSTGNLRYQPSNELLEYIKNIQDFVLTAGFREKFNTQELPLLDFLYFVDLLAWNEDVKYHGIKGTPYFANYTESKTGRTNTILSIIGAPILISDFIQDIIYKTANKGVIDVHLITSTIQKFSKTRGLCVLSNEELLTHLAPYLVEKV
ncbi:hypothetical protein RsTz2092_12770 [Deferribacterales bacterium RsTz2092]|nr:hypothetical protein AGMMS49941_04840 [Deferribacterales bacterium]